MVPNANFIYKRNNRSKNNLFYWKSQKMRLRCFNQARSATLNEAFFKDHPKKSRNGAINQIASQEKLVVLAQTVTDFSRKLLYLHQGLTSADTFLLLHFPWIHSIARARGIGSTFTHAPENSPQHKNPFHTSPHQVIFVFLFSIY